MRKLFDTLGSVTQRLFSGSPAKAAKRGRPRNRLQRFEQLEQRTLLSITSEGLAALHIDDVHERFLATGSGVSVGVIADGIGDLAASQIAGELPPVASSSAGSGKEGTAMLEVIHDIAPGASLFFAPANSASSFADAVNYLRTVDLDGAGPGGATGVDIIVAAPWVYNQPWFQDGPAAQAASAAVDAGIVFVNAAGDDGAAIHYQGRFSHFTGTPLDNKAGVHNFGGSDLLVFDVPAGGTVDVDLQWSTPWGQSTDKDDLDLYLYQRSGSGWMQAAKSDTRINSGQYGNPMESLTYTNISGATMQVALQVDFAYGHLAPDYVPWPNVTLELFAHGDVAPASDAHGGSIAYTSTDQIFGPAAVASAITVGTINVGDAGLDDVAAYSSRGPSTMISGATTVETRNSLDGVAVDQVSTQVLGAEGFAGTAAAAAHVGGMAALAFEAAPSLTPGQIEGILRITAVDIGTTGYDQTAGAGRFDALEAAYYLYTPDAPDLDAGSDSGISQTDNITNDKTPTFTGAVPPGSFVALYEGTTLLGSQQLAAGAGNYSITSGALADGVHKITVKVASSATGTQWNRSPELAVTIDTAAPTASIPAVSPDPHHMSISQFGVNFSEVVAGVGVGDFALTRGGLPVAFSGNESVATSDGRFYTLAGMVEETETPGEYVLTLVAAGSGITDVAGNSLAASVSESWLNDTLRIDLGEGDDAVVIRVGQPHVVEVNGAVSTWDSAVVKFIEINGTKGGTDSIAFYGDANHDSVTLGGDTLDTYSSTSKLDVRAFGFESISAYSGGGDETASFSGTVWDDTFVARPEEATLTSSGGYVNYASGFKSYSASLQGNDALGTDKAYLYDSPGSDAFGGANGAITMYLGGADIQNPTLRANYFDEVYGYASTDAGGAGDQVWFGGTSGDDTFVGNETSATISGVGFKYVASGFDSYEADVAVGTNVGGNDVAYLHGSAGNDTFDATPTSATITRTGSSTSKATGFDRVYGFAGEGSRDQAYLTGVAGANFFYSSQIAGRMMDRAGSYYNCAWGFDYVEVNAPSDGTPDNAYFYDTSGDDTFRGGAAQSSMEFSGGGQHVVKGFKYVDAYASTHGQQGDRALFEGSAGNDQLYARENHAQLTDSAKSYYVSAFGFGYVEADASNAGGQGDDHAFLYDSVLDDVLTMSPARSSMTLASGCTSIAIGFDGVHGYASAAGLAGDIASFAGSDGDDTFVATETGATLSGGDVHLGAHYFDSYEADLSVQGTAGTDIAYLYGTSGSDIFEATGALASFELSTRVKMDVTRFDRVYAFAMEGALDEAILGDTDEDEFFYGSEIAGRMMDRGGSYYNCAWGFDSVTVNGGVGDDNAYLYDSALDDIFSAGPGVAPATMDWGGNGADLTITGYRRLHVDFSQGGFDRVDLVDTMEADRFFGRGDRGCLTDDSTYWIDFRFSGNFDDTVNLIFSGSAKKNKIEVSGLTYDLVYDPSMWDDGT